MNDKIGKLGGVWVWLFALSAVLLGMGSGYVTAGMGAKISSAVYFGIFLVSGFAAMALTKAKALLGIAAFLLAALISAAGYFWVAAQAMTEATSALGAAEVGGTLGAAMGAFVAVITFLVSATGGVTGAVAGVRARKQLAAA
ncbi:MAG: hypothetical protein VYE22_29830 [Myxococcota bacterium]|nr:hypothetical protein [Myxococcota bacterium]